MINDEHLRTVATVLDAAERRWRDCIPSGIFSEAATLVMVAVIGTIDGLREDLGLPVPPRRGAEDSPVVRRDPALEPATMPPLLPAVLTAAAFFIGLTMFAMGMSTNRPALMLLSLVPAVAAVAWVLWRRPPAKENAPPGG